MHVRKCSPVSGEKTCHFFVAPDNLVYLDDDKKPFSTGI